jgi:type IV secretory pathway VirB2 component (pilin)
MMKKIFFFSFALFILIIAPHALAQEFVPLAPIPGLTEGADASSTDGLPTFFNNLYKFLIGIAAILAIIQIIRSGIELALNQGSVSEILSAKGRVAQAIFGLVLVLTPALVFDIINPDILRLSVSLPDITYTERSFDGYSFSTTTQNGSRFSVRGTYLQEAVFSSPDKALAEADAGLWIASCPYYGRVLSDTTFIGNRPVASCTEFSGGVCVGGFSVTAQCSHRTGSPLTFLLIADPLSVFEDFIATDRGVFDSFESECSKDGGQTCVIAPINSLGARTENVACPSNIVIPGDAPNADSGGKCRRNYVVCSPPDLAEIRLCSTSERLYK